MEATSSQVPEQAKVRGSWKKVDTSLVEQDGWLVPSVAAVPIRISLGGSNDIMQVKTEDGGWITESWAYGTLPAPIVKKNSATFPEVLPGVDLRVRATKAGAREVLIVKNAEAARDERVANFRLRISGATLSQDPETEVLTAGTGDGVPLMASTPLWWDSSGEKSDADGPGGGEAKAVSVTATATESTLDVEAIADDVVAYPLFVDPDWSAYLQYDWFTDRAFPNQSYLNPPENSVGYGIENGVHYLSRAFYRFDTAFLAGKQVSDARFNVYQTWSNSCDTTLVQLWQYGPSNPGFTWNSDPAQWVRAIDAQGNVRGSSCAAPGMVGFSATPTASDAAVYEAPYITLALRSANEGSPLTRKHYRWDAKLTVTYNSAPNVPTNLAMSSPARPCVSDAANPAFLNNAVQAVTLTAKATDPDPGAVAVDFFLKNITTGVETKVSTTPLQAQGSLLTHVIPKGSLVNGNTYAWSTRSSDYAATSARSASCYFTADATSPGVPGVVVTSASSPAEGRPGTVDLGTRIGQKMTVRVTTAPLDKVAGFQVWWQAGDKTATSAPPPVTEYWSLLPTCDTMVAAKAARIVCADSTGSATFDLAAFDTNATLWVAAYDRAGNVSKVGNEYGAGGIGTRAASADLSAGHIWQASTSGQKSIDDELNGTPSLNVGSLAKWGTDEDDNPSMVFDGLVTLGRYIWPGHDHRAIASGVSVPSGYRLEQTMGQLGRIEPGKPQPANTNIVYLCEVAPGNRTSLSAACDGKGVTGVAIGYSWKTAAAVPTGVGYKGVQVYRCVQNGDYFDTRQADCEGNTSVGSLGFLIDNAVTATTAAPLDTTSSFSVSVRAIPSTFVDDRQTLVSQESASFSPFLLQIAWGKWRFCVQSQGPSAAAGCVTGPSVQPGKAATITGTWDALNRVVRIKVVADGVSDSQYAAFAPPKDNSTSTGRLLVGSAISSGSSSDGYKGQVVAVGIYPGVLSSTQLAMTPLPR
ncbi:hypothetical protein GCM10027406_25970 [Leifsonia lichenia]